MGDTTYPISKKDSTMFKENSLTASPNRRVPVSSFVATNKERAGRHDCSDSERTLDRNWIASTWIDWPWFDGSYAIAIAARICCSGDDVFMEIRIRINQDCSTASISESLYYSITRSFESSSLRIFSKDEYRWERVGLPLCFFWRKEDWKVSMSKLRERFSILQRVAQNANVWARAILSKLILSILQVF